MSLPLRVAGALAVALLLAGCTPETVSAADFLLDGTPGVFDADGFWKGHYGFFTDDTKTAIRSASTSRSSRPATRASRGATAGPAATKVLKDNQRLLVSHDNEQFTCTVATGVASCADAGTGASIRLGLGVAEFQG